MNEKMFTLGHADSAMEAQKNYTAKVAAAAADAINEIDGIKSDKSLSGTISIPTTGWNSDSTTGFPYYYDITVAGVTSDDRADLNIAIDSAIVATQCGFCLQTNTLSEKIRVRVASIPSDTIFADYWVLKK